MIPRNPEQFWIARLKRKASLPVRGFDVRFADGLRAKVTYGPAIVAMRGIRSIREASVPRAFINGHRRSACRARAGHRIRIGIRKVDRTHRKVLMSQRT